MIRRETASSRRKMVGGLFVHYSSINMPGFKSLAEGDRISFEVEETKRVPQAIEVKRF